MINFQAMRNTMAMLWRPLQGVSINELHNDSERKEQRYLFRFFHEVDVKRVEDGGPWTFNNYHILLHRLVEHEDPQDVDINWVDFWIQAYRVPIGFRSEKVARNIGNYIEKYVDSHPNNFDDSWRDYMRIRVKVDATKPIISSMNIKKVGGVWFKIEFKYERLVIFYFICGLIGHSDKFFHKILENSVIEHTLSKDVRAPPRRTQVASVGERWLRDGRSSKSGQEWCNPLQYGINMNQGVNVAVQSNSSVRKESKDVAGENYGNGLGSNKGEVFGPKLTSKEDKEGIVIHEDKRRNMEEAVTLNKEGPYNLGLNTHMDQLGKEVLTQSSTFPKNLNGAGLGLDQACKPI
ncbi:hypothetical protein RCOM_1166040 [Ricinus communis]|uniref:DUF4283 domain-containing protein n=1 Tax=Ricinus communis TaxID=3988 RepID=B9T3N5_RICCO|nr:hypothetical protein RCOM_1166040 [Ricinus communis]